MCLVMGVYKSEDDNNQPNHQNHCSGERNECHNPPADVHFLQNIRCSRVFHIGGGNLLRRAVFCF